MIAEFESYYIIAVQEKDAWALCNFMIANEDRFKRFMPQTLVQNVTPELSKIFAAKKEKQFAAKEELLFLVKEKETKDLVGLVYLKNFDWETKQAEFAYCIGYQFKGKGLISKAVKLLSSYAFDVLALKSLQIITHKRNSSSVKVAKENSFIWQKILKNEFIPTGESPVDMELYQLYKQ
jgi:ribosomal-protein-alanine N-acetyltransferase